MKQHKKKLFIFNLTIANREKIIFQALYDRRNVFNFFFFHYYSSSLYIMKDESEMEKLISKFGKNNQPKP